MKEWGAQYTAMQKRNKLALNKKREGQNAKSKFYYLGEAI